MTVRVLKYTVPVDDQWHPIPDQPVLHVACQHGPESVQVWVLDHGDDLVGKENPVRPMRVFGTGQDLPSGLLHVGSTVTADGALVWHLFASYKEAVVAS